MSNLKAFIQNSKHILNISYKPSNEEFSKTARIIIIGILIIGVVGFVISVLVSIISGIPLP
ncbi:MAG: protein translocase SEC61 complex subunit gamma [Candidatus Marsarchaeota archaeon]|nr:protein translocase SEC61 complex subunit gamma [Candidatus Marsarchaeota archaeon]